MKALSGYAEWFWLMAKGWKDVENRPKPLPQSLAVSLPVRIYLHASKSDQVQRVPGDLEFILSRLTSEQIDEFCDVDWSNLRGKIIGEITITGQMRKHTYREADHVDMGSQQKELELLIASRSPCRSPWFFGPFGYIVTDGALYETLIPCRGMLGFFEPVIPTVYLKAR